MRYYKQSAKVHMYHILQKYFPMETSKSMARNKVDPAAITMQPIHLLPVRATDIYTLPTLDLNEARIEDTIEILTAFMDELGIPLNSMADKVALVKGDWLTIRNINSSLFLRQDAVNQEETFDFLEPVMGLFHLQMNVLRLMISNYWGRVDAKDIASIHHFVRMVGNNRVKKTGKDFRACLNFINDLLDGHVLALLFSAADVETSEQFAKALEKGLGWPDMLDTLSGDIYSSKVSGWRQGADGTKVEVVKRDIPLENALLFLRDMLVFRDYEDAVKCGDTGRVAKCIEYWCVLFQGTALKNYASEMVHLTACIKHIWDKPLRDLWMENCLVNPSGNPGGWMPDDMFGEYVVRENKKRIRPSSNALSGDFNREVHALQVGLLIKLQSVVS